MEEVRAAALRPGLPCPSRPPVLRRFDSILDVFLGRQPIFGRNLEVFAYELLYRDGSVGTANFSDGDSATSRVLVNAFTEIGLDRVVGGRLAFVNLTRGFITGEFPLPAVPDRLILEVLEDVRSEPEILQGLRILAGRGYRIALDDFELCSENEALVDLAEIVKLDFRSLDEQQLREHTRELSRRGCRLLAEKVETQEEYEFCRELGFELFQGYFLAKPKVLHTQALPAGHATLLSLISRLQASDCDLNEIAKLVERDVSVSYRVLKHINSSLYGLRFQVQSIREAVIYLGLYKVRNLVTLFLLASLDSTPPALVETAILRGRMAELLGKAAQHQRADTFFTVGLFSTLDAMLNLPMSRVIDRLPLAPEISGALLKGEGELGAALSCVLAYERGDWERARFGKVSREGVREAFLEAVDWVEVSGVSATLAA